MCRSRAVTGYHRQVVSNPLHLRNMNTDRQTDRHHYLKSSNIPKTEGGQILPHFCKQSYDLHSIDNQLTISNSIDANEALWSKSTLQGAYPSLPSTTVLRHVVVLKLSHLTHSFRNVVEKPPQESRNATS